MSETLKPCPFCADDDLAVYGGYYDDCGNLAPSLVICHGCGTEGPEETDRDTAIEAWNRRTPAPDSERWQPIETAPHLTHVLVVTRGGEVRIGVRRDVGWRTVPGSHFILPIRWMPLPAPPSEEKS